MSAPARLGAYALGLVAVFLGAFLVGARVGPVGSAGDSTHHGPGKPSAARAVAAEPTAVELPLSSAAPGSPGRSH